MKKFASREPGTASASGDRIDSLGLADSFGVLYEWR